MWWGWKAQVWGKPLTLFQGNGRCLSHPTPINMTVSVIFFPCRNFAPLCFSLRFSKLLMSSSVPLLPLAAAPPFLNAQKMALLVKVMVRLVCLCANSRKCWRLIVSFLSQATCLHPFLSPSVPSSPLFILRGTLHGLSAWISSSYCNPNNCIHQLWYLHSDPVWHHSSYCRII